MDKTEWEEHEEFIPREEDGESVDISPDGKVVVERWTASPELEEAIFHDTIRPIQPQEQLKLPLEE